MHCSVVYSLVAAAVLFHGCLQGVFGRECYKCYARTSRRTDTCYLGVPTKGLQRTLCDGKDKVCIVAKHYSGRQPDGSWIIVTRRDCVRRQEAQQLCFDHHEQTSTNRSVGHEPQAGNATRSFCTRCHTTLCNTGHALEPSHVLRWLLITSMLLAVLF